MRSYKASAGPLVIGLTGGIGSGKSTVAACLAQLGACVIDADKVGHDSYRQGSEGHEQIVEHFGPGILAADGSIDRGKLGTMVFTDQEARKRLNSIVHPLVAREIARRIADQREQGFGLPIVLEIPLLIETKGMWAVNQVWVVTAQRHLVIARLKQRGIEEAALEARIASQASEDERLKYADVVITNNGSIEELRKRVKAEWINLSEPSD